MKKEKQKQHLIDIMRGDEELGLYDEPKKETIEEAAEKYVKSLNLKVNVDEYKEYAINDFIAGAKYQAERMYSEGDKIMEHLDTEVELNLSDKKTIERIKWYFETYFEQFKRPNP